PRPGLGIEFNPVIPLLHRRTTGHMAALPFELMTHSEYPLTEAPPPRLSAEQSSASHISLAVGHALPSHHETPLKDQQSRHRQYSCKRDVVKLARHQPQKADGENSTNPNHAPPEPVPERSVGDQSCRVGGVIRGMRHHEFSRHHQ